MNNYPLIIAHRGESYDAPENTIAAINLAWQRGADAVEIDIQLSKDKKIVVFHDATTFRLAGKLKRVDNQNFDELEKLDVGNYKGVKYSGEQIPLLREVLKGIPPGKHLFIEIKGKKSLANELYFLRDLILQRNIHFISFDMQALVETKSQFPQAPCYFISEKRKNMFANSVIDKLIQKTLDNKLDGLDLDYRLIKSDVDVNKIKKAGLKIFTWTVDDLSSAKKLALWKVDGITTNRAQWLSRELRRKLNEEA